MNVLGKLNLTGMRPAVTEALDQVRGQLAQLGPAVRAGGAGEGEANPASGQPSSPHQAGPGAGRADL